MTSCPVYDWCESAHATPHPDDQNTHTTTLAIGEFGDGNRRGIDVSWHPVDGLTFAVDCADWWEIRPDRIDAEIADEIATLQRAAAVMHDFVSKFAEFDDAARDGGAL